MDVDCRFQNARCLIKVILQSLKLKPVALWVKSQSQEKLLSCRISERSGSGNEAVMFQQNVRNSGNDAGPVSTGQRQNELVGHVGHLVRNLSEVR